MSSVSFEPVLSLPSGRQKKKQSLAKCFVVVFCETNLIVLCPFPKRKQDLSFEGHKGLISVYFPKVVKKGYFEMFKSLQNIRLLTRLSSNLNGTGCGYSLKYFCVKEISNEPFASHEQLDNEKKLKIFQLEMDVGRQDGRKVPDPSLLKQEQWDHLLNLNSRSARSKYYTYLWKIEKTNENREEKKLKRREEISKRKEEERQEFETSNHIIYGLSHCGFLLRIYDSTINHWDNNKLMRAMQFGEKIILDCSYDQHMNKREAVNTAKQITLAFAENRMNNEPFDLHFCNVNMKSTTMQYLQKFIPTMTDPSFPMNIHEECFTDEFPKERLVYLTPHCRNDLLDYNPDDIYIIGAIVDKAHSEPLSLAKAKKLGLRMAKLPLDKYLQWGSGSGKCLTLNQVVNILLDVKKTGDWNHAFRHVPKRKITESSELQGNPFRKSQHSANKLRFNMDHSNRNKRYY